MAIIFAVLQLLKAAIIKTKLLLNTQYTTKTAKQVGNYIMSASVLGGSSIQFEHIWAPSGSILANKLVPPLKLISPGRQESQKNVRQTTVYALPRPEVVTDYQLALSRSFAYSAQQRATF